MFCLAICETHYRMGGHEVEMYKACSHVRILESIVPKNEKDLESNETILKKNIIFDGQREGSKKMSLVKLWHFNHRDDVEKFDRTYDKLQKLFQENLIE